jgi:hypothetical protein
VADKESNEQKPQRIEHSRGGISSRDDALDEGVPMLQGDSNEPVGPEDALGFGPKRGDYSHSIPPGYEPTMTVPIPDANKCPGAWPPRLAL